MRFAEPIWLIVGALGVTLLSLLLIRAEVLRGRAIAVLSGARLLNAAALGSRLRTWLRAAAAVGAVAMGFVALARPQVGMHWETLERQGTDLLLVMDTSKSMDADDVKPTRLERAKIAVRDLVERFPGDRVGLVAFAGDAFVESPMTLDHGALLDTVGALDTGVVARGGTDIGRAIDVASAALATEPDHQKLVVLLTDGEDLAASGEDAAKRAGAAGIVIHAVGVGTASGELVPAKDDKGTTVGLVRDENGEPVRSHLDEAGLRRIVQAAHGTYRPFGADGLGLERLYGESLAPLSHVESAAKVRRVYSERFEIPLALSLAGIVLEALLTRRSRSKGNRWSHAKTPALAATAGVMAIALFPGLARASVSTAERAYATGKYEDAAHEYAAEQGKHPKDARFAYNSGAAAYRAGHWDDAVSALAEAVKLGDPKLQQRALYNEGDAQYRAGEVHRTDAREKTIESWKAAIASYDGALALNQADADARFNRDFVQRKLAELQQQQKEQPKEQQPKADKDKKDDKGQNNRPDQQPKSGQQGKADKTGQQGQNDKAGQQGQNDNGAQQGKDDKGGQQGKADPQKPGRSPAPSDQANKSDANHGNQPKADADGKGTDRLSPRDARALLGSLRGEERHGVSRGNDNAKADADVPRKDW